MSPRRAETPRGDRPDSRAAPAAAAGGEASPRPCALQASCRCASGAPRRGDALGLIYATFHGALTALRGLPPRQRADSPPRGSGREGGVSGAGGRELYKSAGGAPAGASFAALRRDRERRGEHGPWRGRCARATQCVDYLQPLLVQYAGAPEQLNGVATPLPGLDHSAAFPYEEDTSE